MEDNEPIKLPIGVLTADTITTFLLMIFVVLLRCAPYNLAASASGVCPANLNFYYKLFNRNPNKSSF
jgi:hypothetical protein